jgi:hypothetical protein
MKYCMSRRTVQVTRLLIGDVTKFSLGLGYASTTSLSNPASTKLKATATTCWNGGTYWYHTYYSSPTPPSSVA